MSQVFALPRTARSGSVTEPSSSPPTGLRLTRPSWRDRRLLLGLVLVLGSTLLGARLAADEPTRVLVWAARADLAAGLTLRPADVVAREVELGEQARVYLAADDRWPGDLVLARDVAAGELLPRAAVSVGAPAPAARVVTLPVGAFRAPADLRRGDRVDVYVLPDSAGGAGSSPRLLASGVPVVEVDDTGGAFAAGGDERGVELAVAQGEVAAVVAAATAEPLLVRHGSVVP